MYVFKIKYEDDTFEIVTAEKIIDVIKKYNLATREHINTRVIELTGEQRAIALSNL